MLQQLSMQLRLVLIYTVHYKQCILKVVAHCAGLVRFIKVQKYLAWRSGCERVVPGQVPPAARLELKKQLKAV